MGLKLMCVLLLFFIERAMPVNGVQCYNCESRSQKACSDKFGLTSSNTSYILGNCDVCNKYYFKDSDVYVRNCTPKSSTGFSFKTGCEEKKDAGEKVKACGCSNELCNGARSEFAALLILIFMCLSVYSLYHLIAFDLHLN